MDGAAAETLKPALQRLGLALGVLLIISAGQAPAATFKPTRTRSARRSFAINLRRRLNVQPLITDPGTVELDWNFLLSNQASDFSLPTTLRITPEGPYVFWGRSEFSVNFDAVESSTASGSRVNHFTDRVNLAMTSVLVDAAHFDLAAGPEVTILTRGDHGARLGGFLIGRGDWGRNSAGFTANWTGATAASDTNPAGTLDVGFGGGRRLGTKGLAGQLTLHGNYLYERSTGVAGFHSIFEGVEIELSDRVALDLSAQHIGLGPGGGAVDHQFLAGLSINLGRYRH